MRWIAPVFAVTLTAFMLPLPAQAQDSETEAMVPPDPESFRPVVTAIVDGVILPDHEKFAVAARDFARAMPAFCENPSPDDLGITKGEFARLVMAWSRVEVWRMGPALSDNRHDRLYYWPDRGGRGLRQVEALLKSDDDKATDPDALYAGSVALQGIPALDYLLAGDGAQVLTEHDGIRRCHFASAIAQVVARNADALNTDWHGPNGYGALMRDSGPDNAIYRNPGEAMRDILTRAAEAVQVVRERKLIPALGDGPDSARPKLAPLWRSDLVVPAVLSELEAVASLLEPGRLPALEAMGSLPAWVSGTRFDLREAMKAITRATDGSPDWAQELAEPSRHKLLSYGVIPLSSAEKRLGFELPSMLGMVAGFNALDGD